MSNTQLAINLPKIDNTQWTVETLFEKLAADRPEKVQGEQQEQVFESDSKAGDFIATTKDEGGQIIEARRGDGTSAVVTFTKQIDNPQSTEDYARLVLRDIILGGVMQRFAGQRLAVVQAAAQKLMDDEQAAIAAIVVEGGEVVADAQ